VPEHLGLRFFALGVLIVCSAILTGAEAAYFSLGRARLRHVADKDDPEGAPKPLIERPHELLVTLLVGITVINIGAAALAATIADDLFGQRWGLIVQIVVLVFILTTFGEVLPMTLAVKYPERFLALAGRPIEWLGVLLRPVRAVLTGLTELTVRLIGNARSDQAMLTEEELRTLVDVGASEGVVEREEREMIHKVFELEDTPVRAVMVPRTDMVCLDVETTPSEILPALREHLHSRVPVYEGSIDVIVGILYTKDLLPYIEGLPAGFVLREHLHPPYFVPESKRADMLLQEFQAKKLHMAIVVDEYGGTAGLVTLEDIIVRAWEGNRWHVDITPGLRDDARFDFLMVLPQQEAAATCLGLLQSEIEQHFAVHVKRERRMRDVYALTHTNPRGQMLRRYPDPEPGACFSSLAFSVFMGRSKVTPMFPLDAFAVHSYPFMFLVNWFEEILGGQVIDETSLRGIYGFELKERVDYRGRVLEPLDEENARTVLKRARADGFQACAITLIHAWKYPEQESRLAEIAREVGFSQVSTSHCVSPLLRIVPRGDTTVRKV